MFIFLDNFGRGLAFATDSLRVLIWRKKTSLCCTSTIRMTAVQILIPVLDLESKVVHAQTFKNNRNINCTTNYCLEKININENYSRKIIFNCLLDPPGVKESD